MPLTSQGVSLKVAGVDSTGNVTINDLLGNRNDTDEAETIFGTSLHTYEHTHHSMKVYPTLANAVLVTAANAAWTLGNFAEIVPINTITHTFHIHHVQIISASANGQYELVVYAGAVEITRMTFSRTDKKDDVEGLVLICPHIAANSQIQVKLASGNVGADTAAVKVWYQEHPD